MGVTSVFFVDAAAHLLACLPVHLPACAFPHLGFFGRAESTPCGEPSILPSKITSQSQNYDQNDAALATRPAIGSEDRINSPNGNSRTEYTPCGETPTRPRKSLHESKIIIKMMQNSQQGLPSSPRIELIPQTAILTGLTLGSQSDFRGLADGSQRALRGPSEGSQVAREW